MKVFYLITKSERGGAQVHLLDLVRRLRNQVEAIVCCGDEGFLTAECRKLGVEVCIVPDLVHPIRPLRDARAVLRVSALLRRYRPDVIHGHTGKAGLVSRIAARLTHTPAIYTVHSWTFVSNSKLTALLTTFIERAMRFTGGVIVEVSHCNYRTACRRRVASPKRHVTIWNGVPDSPRRAQSDTRIPVRIIMTARFAWPKDHAFLLHALARIDDPWHLTLVGDGPNRAAIEQLSISLRIRDRIEFMGDTEEVESLLVSSDIFVLTSESEGLPLSIMEAMRAGLPVIASGVGGVPELVADQVSGYLIRTGDTNLLEQRLRSLLSSAEDRSRMGILGRLRYERDFNIESMVGATYSLYREYCNSAS